MDYLVLIASLCCVCKSAQQGIRTVDEICSADYFMSMNTSLTALFVLQ